MLGLVPESVSWTGNITAFESSPGTFRDFCPDCGTRLTFRSAKWPGEVHIHAATLEDSEDYRPTLHVVTRDDPPWLCLTDEIPQSADFDTAPRTDPPGLE